VVIAAPSVSISQGSHAGTAGVKALGLESFGSSRESHGRCHEKNSNQEVIVELDGITRSYLPLVPLGVRESDLAILATWPNHVTHKIISTPPSLYVVYIVIQLHNYV
jgi:hypothetical protein